MNGSFSFLPVLTLAAAFVALVFIAVLGGKRGSIGPKSRLILILVSGVVLTGTLSLVLRALRTPGHASTPVEIYEVTVEFSASQTRTELVPVPFRVGSGSLNLGCEEERSVPVNFLLPPGAENVTAHAEWVNVDNIAFQTSSHPEISATQVVAIGTIRGLQRTFLFNCPGGGHGELILQGQYILKKSVPSGETVIKTVKDFAHRGQVFTATIPPILDSGSVICTIRVSNVHGTSDVVGTISAAQKGDFQFKIKWRAGVLPNDIKINGQTLVLNM